MYNHTATDSQLGFCSCCNRPLTAHDVRMGPGDECMECAWEDADAYQAPAQDTRSQYVRGQYQAGVAQ